MTNLFDDLVARYGLTMTPKQASELLQCHPTHIRVMCASGELPAVKIGDRWHVLTAKLAVMLEGGEQ